MENPHAEQQAVLLERILKNSSKCTETISELNRCLEVRQPIVASSRAHTSPQQILRANASVKIAADLTTKYRKNVQYNLEATRGGVP
ncbi:hypothetical protein EDD18DRAFT_1192480 [Armillaria luteobubalina]|uniref:DASH complex subunit DAD4 n=1 Tax=Armillaria luteobubalina TaxID=153913 RepID=A0AA39PMQ3_9AGAR|nr:hypothetical protein EDD18DRAFT_1192480 [Armillaria luteobubalina]